MNSDIQHAHRLLSHLAPDQVSAVVRLMEVMLNPALRAVSTSPPPPPFPLEDEEISEEEERSAAESREWFRHNEPIPHEDVLADFGLTMADFERMGQIPQPTPNGQSH